jgi:hypothetical protein
MIKLTHKLHARLLLTAQCAVSTLALFAASAAAQIQATAEHELLKSQVGKWDAEMKLFHAPGAEPEVEQCTETVELLPGGMWITSRFEGKIMGMPFTGIGTSGYDPTEKKFVGTWVDSMSPYMQTIKGEYDAATKTMTSTSVSRNPMNGEEVTYKEIGRTIDDDTRTFEMHMPNEKGEYVKMMEIKYTRKK